MKGERLFSNSRFGNPDWRIIDCKVPGLISSFSYARLRQQNGPLRPLAPV